MTSNGSPPQRGVPSAIRDLLASRIDSFEKLDMVVALHGAPRATLSIDVLARTMGCTREVVRETIGELRRGLLVDLTSRGEVQLMTPTEAERETVSQLVLLHAEDRAAVVRLLGEIALDRIRGMAARAFADAFVIGKSKSKKGEDPDG